MDANSQDYLCFFRRGMETDSDACMVNFLQDRVLDTDHCQVCTDPMCMAYHVIWTDHGMVWAI